MRSMLANIAPELMLAGIACILFLLGCSNKRSSRQMAPFLALIALVFVLIPVFARRNMSRIDPLDSPVVIDGMAHFIRALAPMVAKCSVRNPFTTSPSSSTRLPMARGGGTAATNAPNRSRGMA